MTPQATAMLAVLALGICLEIRARAALKKSAGRPGACRSAEIPPIAPSRRPAPFSVIEGGRRG